MVMSLFAGVMVDRLGTRKCVFIFIGLCFIGQVRTASPALALRATAHGRRPRAHARAGGVLGGRHRLRHALSAASLHRHVLVR
jgi:hypothetical protein